LRALVADLAATPADGIICARKPWSASSDAVITKPTEQLGVPSTLRSDGYEYFLEVFVARDVLAALPEPRTVDDQVALLIYYAENDAYPDWLFGSN
jgi:hypothetical protein